MQEYKLQPICKNIPTGITAEYINSDNLEVILNLSLFGHTVRTFPSADLRYIKTTVDILMSSWDILIKTLVKITNEYYLKRGNSKKKICVCKEDIFIEKIVYYPLNEKEYFSTVMITYNFGEASITIPVLIIY